jgi:hypothetical protein
MLFDSLAAQDAGTGAPTEKKWRGRFLTSRWPDSSGNGNMVLPRALQPAACQRTILAGVIRNLKTG